MKWHSGRSGLSPNCTHYFFTTILEQEVSLITASSRLGKGQMQWQDALKSGIWLCFSPSRRTINQEGTSVRRWQILLSVSSGFHQLSCVWSVCGLMEKKDETCISFSTSGTVVPAGPLCAACRECVAFGVLYLSAMAGMAWWLLATRGVIATQGCPLPMLHSLTHTFLASTLLLQKHLFSLTAKGSHTFHWCDLQLLPQFCKGKMDQLKHYSDQKSDWLLLSVIKWRWML